MDVDVVLGRREQKGRTGDAPAGGTIGLLVLAVDGQAGPVVLAHAVDHCRILQCGPHVGMVGFSPSRPLTASGTGVGIGVDHPLGRLVNLTEKPPVPPRTDEGLVEPLEVLDHRQAVHDDEPRDSIRMVHRRAEGDHRAAIVADHRAPVMPKGVQKRDNVAGHRPLGRLDVPDASGGSDDCPCPSPPWRTRTVTSPRSTWSSSNPSNIATSLPKCCSMGHPPVVLPGLGAPTWVRPVRRG
jgi:hypothetical protein